MKSILAALAIAACPLTAQADFDCDQFGRFALSAALDRDKGYTEAEAINRIIVRGPLTDMSMAMVAVVVSSVYEFPRLVPADEAIRARTTCEQVESEGNPRSKGSYQ